MKVSCLGKSISKELVLTSPLYILSAANSGDLKKGIGNSFLSVNGVFIKPGETTETFTLQIQSDCNWLDIVLLN